MSLSVQQILASAIAATVGNALVTKDQTRAAENAAQVQQETANKIIEAQQQATAPYRKAGQQALQQIQDIESDPSSYIKNNELYNTLAAEAERRLLSNRAASGKIGSGGTASELQKQLLTLGNTLTQNKIGQLQDRVRLGANVSADTARGVSSAMAQGADARAAGLIGASNTFAGGYENMINTLLALRGFGNTGYAPGSNNEDKTGAPRVNFAKLNI